MAPPLSADTIRRRRAQEASARSFNAGSDAALAGIDHTANPHDGDGSHAKMLRRAWDQGWRDAQHIFGAWVKPGRRAV